MTMIIMYSDENTHDEFNSSDDDNDDDDRQNYWTQSSSSLQSLHHIYICPLSKNVYIPLNSS